MNHPSIYFTEQEAKAFNEQIRKNLESRKATTATTAPKPVPLPVITNWFEAKQARLNFEMQADLEKSYRDAAEEHFSVCEKIAWLEKMLPTCSLEERRLILGWEERNRLVPGELPTTRHIPGNLELLKGKRDAIEEKLPLLKMKSDAYVALREHLSAWPWSMINRLQREEHERRLVVQGKEVQFRGNRNAPVIP